MPITAGLGLGLARSLFIRFYSYLLYDFIF